MGAAGRGRHDQGAARWERLGNRSARMVPRLAGARAAAARGAHDQRTTTTRGAAAERVAGAAGDIFDHLVNVNASLNSPGTAGVPPAVPGYRRTLSNILFVVF